MKAKYYVMLAALGVAFVAASAWVYLSRGENAKAVRLKFRLGGMMLSITSLLTLTSCGDPVGPTCYDPEPPTCYDPVTEVEVEPASSWEVHVGDTVLFNIYERNYESYSYNITTADGEDLQKGDMGIEGILGHVVIKETDYKGAIMIALFGNKETGPKLVGEWRFNLVQ